MLNPDDAPKGSAFDSFSSTLTNLANAAQSITGGVVAPKPAPTSAPAAAPIAVVSAGNSPQNPFLSGSSPVIKWVLVGAAVLVGYMIIKKLV